jgi:hypothetical protein
MPVPANQRQNEREYHLKPTRIALKGAFLEVNDVSSGGIGVVLEKDGPEFNTGERLDAIPLELTDGRVHLQGVVSHISVATDKTICGIRFLLTGDQFDTIIQFKKEQGL